jgi:hypothetical protein
VKHIPLSRGMTALVDNADYDWLNQWSWYAFKNSNRFYAVRNIQLPDGRRTTVYMHRAILTAPTGTEVDHQDGDGLNNQRSNLRLATHSQNCCNRGIPSTNTSGFKGVTWHKPSGKWRAYIKVDGYARNLGGFADINDAAAAYDTAALRYHQSFARTNASLAAA